MFAKYIRFCRGCLGVYRVLPGISINHCKGIISKLVYRVYKAFRVYDWLFKEFVGDEILANCMGMVSSAARFTSTQIESQKSSYKDPY